MVLIDNGMVIWNPDTKCLGFFWSKMSGTQMVWLIKWSAHFENWTKKCPKSEMFEISGFWQSDGYCIECWLYFICFCADKKSVMKTRIQAELSRQVSSQWNPPCVHPSGLRPNQDGSFSRQGRYMCVTFSRQGTCASHFQDKVHVRHISRQGTCASTRRLAQTRVDLREFLGTF